MKKANNIWYCNASTSKIQADIVKYLNGYSELPLIASFYSERILEYHCYCNSFKRIAGTVQLQTSGSVPKCTLTASSRWHEWLV